MASLLAACHTSGAPPRGHRHSYTHLKAEVLLALNKMLRPLPVEDKLVYDTLRHILVAALEVYGIYHRRLVEVPQASYTFLGSRLNTYYSF